MMARTLLCLLLLTLWSESARADNEVYVYESVGFLKLSGELAQHIGNRGTQVSLGIGYHLNSEWAVELMGRVGIFEDSANAYGTNDMLGWGVRAKRFHVLSKGLRFYGRGGITENFVELYSPNLAGFGLEYGMGIQYTARVPALGFLFWPLFFTDLGPKVNAILLADLGGELGNVHAGHAPGAASYSYRTAALTFGLGIGGRF